MLIESRYPRSYDGSKFRQTLIKFYGKSLATMGVVFKLS